MGEPAMPTWLSKAAQRIWREKTEELRAMGILYKIGGDQLANYCTAMAHGELAEKDIQVNGISYEEPVLNVAGFVVGHKTKPNPSLRAWNDAVKIAKSIAAEFGMTPSSQTRVHVEQPKQKSAYEAYMSKSSPANADTKPN